LGGKDDGFDVLGGGFEENFQVLEAAPHFHEVLFVDGLLVSAALEGEEFFANVVFVELAESVGDEAGHVGADEDGCFLLGLEELLATEDGRVERKIAGGGIELAFGEAAVDGIPERADIQHAAALFHVWPNLQFVQKLVNRIVFFQAKEGFGMFSPEGDVKTSTRHRGTLGKGSEGERGGGRVQGSGFRRQKIYYHKLLSAKGWEGLASFGFGRAFNKAEAMRRSSWVVILRFMGEEGTIVTG
jgi:hypothetical protein